MYAVKNKWSNIFFTFFVSFCGISSHAFADTVVPANWAIIEGNISSNSQTVSLSVSSSSPIGCEAINASVVSQSGTPVWTTHFGVSGNSYQYTIGSSIPNTSTTSGVCTYSMVANSLMALSNTSTTSAISFISDPNGGAGLTVLSVGDEWGLNFWKSPNGFGYPENPLLTTAYQNTGSLFVLGSNQDLNYAYIPFVTIGEPAPVTPPDPQNPPNEECSITNLSGCLTRLFYPSKEKIEQLYSIKDLIATKPPFGYFTVIKNLWSQFSFEDVTPTGIQIPGLRDGVKYLIYFYTLVLIWNRAKNIEV